MNESYIKIYLEEDSFKEIMRKVVDFNHLSIHKSDTNIFEKRENGNLNILRSIQAARGE